MDDDENMEHPCARVGAEQHAAKVNAGNLRQMAETLDVMWMEPEAITKVITMLIDTRARVRERKLMWAR